MTNTTQQTEIFRHLRPKWFDKKTFSLNTHVNGGISFMLRPTNEGQYNYWIYCCPLNIPFSAKQAVKSLRGVVARNVVPWGTLVINENPLIEQLTHELIQMPDFSVGGIISQIIDINKKAEEKLLLEKQKISNKVSIYENS